MRLSAISLALLACVTSPRASDAARSDEVLFTGACDASAAVQVSADRMLVADDEDQNIRLYSISRGGAPLAVTNVGDELNLTDVKHGEPREVDIEGAVRVGERVYWIGSHGNSRK